ncbi:cadherin-like beta sandwich domain-containing protein, partial [Pedobacter borealis]|uniref:YVTN family beta-propeller repeat protein n=1 Tax=Pedobacter borealis TaxID=475254 RepID=UPI00068F78B0
MIQTFTHLISKKLSLICLATLLFVACTFVQAGGSTLTFNSKKHSVSTVTSPGNIGTGDVTTEVLVKTAIRPALGNIVALGPVPGISFFSPVASFVGVSTLIKDAKSKDYTVFTTGGQSTIVKPNIGKIVTAKAGRIRQVSLGNFITTAGVQPPSSTLSNLVLSSGALSPVFAAGTPSYTAVVANATASLTITPTLTDPAATIKVNGVAVASGSASGSISLNVGTNTITTMVTAQDGSNIHIYKVYVMRQAPNQTLTSGSTTTAVTLAAPGVVYNWTNDKPSISLAASGTGNIASFTATNNTTSPVTATITATPVSFLYIPNSGDGTVSVVNTATNLVTATIGVGGSPKGVSVSPDGSTVYVTNSDDGTVSVINSATNTVTATINVGMSPNGVAVSPDGSKVYVTNYNGGTISVINAATNTVTATINVGDGPIVISVNPNGNNIYVTNFFSNTVSVINTVSNTVVTTINVGNLPVGVAISPDGSKVYVTNYNDDTVSVINTATNTVTATIPSSNASPGGISVSIDGSTLYVTGSDGVSVISTATNTVTATIGVGSGPTWVSVSPDGSKVYVTNYSDGTVSVINTADNSVTTPITVGGAPYSIGNFITGTGLQPLSFTVTVNPNPEIITFGALPTKTYGDADFSPGATSNNGPPPAINYASDNTAVATIVNGNIHIVGAGTANITASQAADNIHAAAANVSQLLTVTKAALTIAGNNQSKVYGTANPTLTVTYTGFVNG